MIVLDAPFDNIFNQYIGSLSQTNTFTMNSKADLLVITASSGENLKLAERFVQLGIQLGCKPELIDLTTLDLPLYNPRTHASKGIPSFIEQLTQQMELNLKVFQSSVSPARMEALYGRLWETKSIEDIEKYHVIRKVKPLEHALNDLEVECWGSGVRGNQTDHRQSMTHLDPIRGRLSLRPLLDWTKKDIFYYMQENRLPHHPLFEKGYSTVGDWHSSGPDNENSKGRETRFGGLKQECGIHLTGKTSNDEKD